MLGCACNGYQPSPLESLMADALRIVPAAPIEWDALDAIARVVPDAPALVLMLAASGRTPTREATYQAADFAIERAKDHSANGGAFQPDIVRAAIVLAHYAALRSTDEQSKTRDYLQDAVHAAERLMVLQHWEVLDRRRRRNAQDADEPSPILTDHDRGGTDG